MLLTNTSGGVAAVGGLGRRRRWWRRYALLAVCYSYSASWTGVGVLFAAAVGLVTTVGHFGGWWNGLKTVVTVRNKSGARRAASRVRSASEIHRVTAVDIRNWGVAFVTRVYRPQTVWTKVLSCRARVVQIITAVHCFARGLTLAAICDSGPARWTGSLVLNAVPGEAVTAK